MISEFRASILDRLQPQLKLFCLSCYREKRSKAETEKARRKLEADLKVNQEMMADIDRGKKDLESNVQRKEREIAEAINKLEGELLYFLHHE